MSRISFAGLIEDSVQEELDLEALEMIYTLLLQNKREIGEALGRSLLAGLPPQSEDLLNLLNRFGARLAFIAVVTGMHYEGRFRYLRRISSHITLAEAFLLRENATAHREFARTWFDQILAYTMAVYAARDLMKQGNVNNVLLACLAERIVISASYQLAHLERILNALLGHYSMHERGQLASRIRRAVSCGMENRWYPRLNAEHYRRGLVELLDKTLPNAPAERLTTLYMKVDLRTVLTPESDAPIEFLNPLAENRSFSYAGLHVPAVLNQFV